MKQPHRWTPYITLNLTVLFWGLSFVATKIALESLPAVALIFIRFSIASCVFLVLMWFCGFPSFTKKEYGKVFLAAVFQPGLYFLFETSGLQYTSASKASLIIATIPIVILCLSILFLKERPTLSVIAGIGLSIVGIALLIGGDSGFRWTLEGSMLGDVFLFGAVLSMAIYTVGLKNFVQTRSALDITGLQMCYGTLFFAPAFLWEFPRIQWTTISGRALIALACLTLFATIGAFLCFNYALAKLSASKTAIFLNCVPVVTAIGAWGILGERLSLIQILGGILVLFSVYLTNLPKNTRVTVGLKKMVTRAGLSRSKV